MTDDCLNDSLVTVWIFEWCLTEFMTDQLADQLTYCVGDWPGNGLIE